MSQDNDGRQQQAQAGSGRNQRSPQSHVRLDDGRPDDGGIQQAGIGPKVAGQVLAACALAMAANAQCNDGEREGIHGQPVNLKAREQLGLKIKKPLQGSCEKGD